MLHKQQDETGWWFINFPPWFGKETYKENNENFNFDDEGLIKGNFLLLESWILSAGFQAAYT